MEPFEWLDAIANGTAERTGVARARPTSSFLCRRLSHITSRSQPHTRHEEVRPFRRLYGTEAFDHDTEAWASSRLRGRLGDALSEGRSANAHQLRRQRRLGTFVSSFIWESSSRLEQFVSFWVSHDTTISRG